MSCASYLSNAFSQSGLLLVLKRIIIRYVLKRINAVSHSADLPNLHLEPVCAPAACCQPPSHGCTCTQLQPPLVMRGSCSIPSPAVTLRACHRLCCAAAATDLPGCSAITGKPSLKCVALIKEEVCKQGGAGASRSLGSRGAPLDLY